MNNLRNIGILGHSAVGKTSLSEALLFCSDTIDRLGVVDDGTTVSDFDNEEKKRGISLTTSVLPFEFNNIKINVVDTPGYFDFLGECIEGMRAVDTAIITVCAVSGVQVGTEKAWNYCNKIKLPRTFFINKLDRENASFEKTLEDIKYHFGKVAVPIQYPIGEENNFIGIVNVITKRARIYNHNTKKMEEGEIPRNLINKVNECKRMITEAVAETDERLLDKYINDEELTDLEIYEGLINGCTTGDIAPVMCGSATKTIGINTLLEDIVECFPSPKYAIPQRAKKLNSNEDLFIKINEKKPFSALVFKTIADPFVGKISLFRVITGKLNGEKDVVNTNKNKNEKLSNVFFMRGKNQIQTKEVVAGDIGAVSKLQYTETGETLCDDSFKVIYDKINFPKANLSMSVLPKNKGDEDKISLGLNRLLEEDPVLDLSRDIENAETIISGLGETHLEVIASKLKFKFGVDVILRLPKVPYRETIKGTADVQGKYKKQSGGHGQYGDVKILFEPRNDNEEELEFIDKVVGGVVPRNFIPAVEKGLRECMSHGVISGYPLIRLRATLHDGSYHPVDSSEMAFKVAASLAYKKGIESASPILLEPIMHVDIIIPNDYMGDIMGDINKKRGRVIGMEPEDGANQRVIAEVPMSEMFKYAIDLRSITQGRGSFEMKFERYEEVPVTEVSKIIESRK